MKTTTVVRIAILACAGLACAAPSSFASSVTGNPLTDGWAAGGNSLEQGTYVRGSANYSFDTYGISTTVASGSILDMSGSDWLVGDTVLGVGGVFTSGNLLSWTVTGTAINADLAHTSGPKLQAKFGTSAATFSASTLAPGGGNGGGSLGTNGGAGAVQVRTTGYNTASKWAAGSGILAAATSDHVDQTGTNADPDANATRIIWNYDSTNSTLVSWEILLNVSLLNRNEPGNFVGGSPTSGFALMTVQDGDNNYTDALVGTVPTAGAAVPLPSAAWMGLGLLSAMGLGIQLRRITA